jgi:glycosyltransferase involved in cell wall biosynthesis
MTRGRILVICQNYPSPSYPFSQPYIHCRLKEYVKVFDVEVVSFAADIDYVYEGIQVYSEAAWGKRAFENHYDVLISHAPNLRNHVRFILQHLFQFPKIVFVFHGYEVIDIKKRVLGHPTYYSYPPLLNRLQKLYHRLKLPLMHIILRTLKAVKQVRFIFVSETLRDEVRKDLNTSLFDDPALTHVVPNPVNPVFLRPVDPGAGRGFLCVRPFADPKYGVDIFIKLAELNPQQSFDLFGLGHFSDSFPRPSNLRVIEKLLEPEDLRRMLPQYQAAILPTRWDSQGVLACEVASSGFPLITSKIPVCEEMLGSFENVLLVDNERLPYLELDRVQLQRTVPAHRYDHHQTTHREISLVQRFIVLNGESAGTVIL